MAQSTKLPKNYENNPFFIATNGITLLFDLARGVTIMFIIFSVLSLFSRGPSGDDASSEKAAEDFVNTLSTWGVTEWSVAVAGVFIVTLAILLIAALFGGVAAYTSAQISKGKKVGFGEAFRVAFDRLWSFLWLQILINVKLFLWTLLFIIPGIIMSFRYSLAGVAFYDDSKDLRGNAAIKESLRLTKGAWLTTFAANTLVNILTLGVISPVVSTAANAVLYKQFDKLDDKKPDAHWLSWVTLILPLVLIVLLIIALVILAAAFSFSER